MYDLSQLTITINFCSTSLPMTITRWVRSTINLFALSTLPKRWAVDKSWQQSNFFVNAENQTWGRLVRSKNYRCVFTYPLNCNQRWVQLFSMFSRLIWVIFVNMRHPQMRQRARPCFEDKLEMLEEHLGKRNIWNSSSGTTTTPQTTTSSTTTTTS